MTAVAHLLLSFPGSQHWDSDVHRLCVWTSGGLELGGAQALP